MKSNELMEEIHSGRIKDNTEIKVCNEDGHVYTTIKYKDGGLKWKTGEFDTKYLCDIEIEFAIIEPKQEIDIQSIKEIDLFDNGHVYKNMQIINESYDLNFNKITNQFNELVQAVKQIDRKIKEKE